MTDQKPTISLAQWCAYLPYGIQVKIEDKNYKLICDNSYGASLSDAIRYNAKPLLRPMNKENEVSINMLLRLHQGDDDNNFLFFYDGKLFSTPEDGSPYVTYEYMPYRYMQMLLSNHYDIFGLIEHGLALPIE